jgi:diguanylate cyclase (GGDEF)-like protein
MTRKKTMAKRPPRTDKKLTLLGKAALFSPLRKEELALIARYSGYCSFGPDDVIFAAGSHVEELYLIEEGTVLIRKGEDDGQQDIARFIQGEVFGELDLLDTAPRSASAIAEGPATLLVFPSRGLAFRDIIEKHPDAFARIFQKLLGVISGRMRAVNRLVSERTPWIQELRRQLLRDKLTGLYNKAFLDEELTAILKASPETSLLVMKPDSFKIINDSFGHDAGDRTLRALAETLKGSLGPGDIGVRYRGDEFCVILPGRGELAAREAAEGLRAAGRSMDIRAIAGDGAPVFTASVGVSTHAGPAADARPLVALSYERMQQARNGGGDSVRGGEATRREDSR